MTTPPSESAEDFVCSEDLVRPGSNLYAWVWILALGLPGMLLFLILEKQQGIFFP